MTEPKLRPRKPRSGFLEFQPPQGKPLADRRSRLAGGLRLSGVMYSAEVLSQLRSLNWLTQELRRLPGGSREGAVLQTQMDAVRSRLPDSILAHHDRLAREGKLTAAEVGGDTCGGCGTKLPIALIRSIAEPGTFGVCPKCGVFVWSAKSGDRQHEAVKERHAPKAGGETGRSPTRAVDRQERDVR